MPFKYSLLCHLLNDLEQNRTKTISKSAFTNSDTQIVHAWFHQHNSIIPRKGREAVAFLSCLFPHRRPDRMYELQERRLEPIIGRALCLGSTRLKDLQRWRNRDGSDFASSVERVMSATDSALPPDSGVTVDQIDEVFDRIAAKSSFSSPRLRADVQARQAVPTDEQSDLTIIFRRLHGLEAKWLVRMLLKSYSPIHIPEKIALQCFHFLLPDLLDIQDSFEAAVELLREPTIAKIPARVTEDTERLLRELAMEHTYERGEKVRRRVLSGPHRPQQRDGPHSDLFQGWKDSTSDREGLHLAIRESLRLGAVDFVIKQQCILEGELLVWNDSRRRLEPFHKIRKHVTRSGRYLGTLLDSPADPDEHLMIMFYDILLLDDIACIKEKLDQRRQRLCSLVQCIRGRVGIGSWQIIDFSSAPTLLQEVFSLAIARQWEGLVLKGCDDTYFSLDGTRFIKLKKDYIAGLGDTADLVIIGGRRDAKDEQELNIGTLLWTSFYIGCLKNKDEVRRVNAKPHFRILDAVGRYSISKTDMRYLNERGKFVQVPFALSTPGLSVMIDQKGLSQPTELFKLPFVVEVMGAGFDKPANVPYFALRFPRVQKVHLDRTIKDTVSFGELQEMAQATHATPQEDDEDGDTGWVETPQSLKHASPSLADTSTSIDSSQSSTGTNTASPTLSLDARMRAEGLVMIEETKTITARPEQQGELDCDINSKGFTSPSSEESVGQLSTQRKRRANTSPLRDGCRKRTRTSTIHAENHQHKQRQSGLAIESWTYKTYERNELVGVESESRDTISRFVPPFFLSSSLFHLFSHPTQPLCKILHRLKISVMFSTDSVIDCGGTTSAWESLADRTKPLARVVFVDKAQVDAAARELKATVKATIQRHASGQLLTVHRVLFFDWSILKGRERLEDISELEWRRAFVGGVLSGCDQIQTNLGEILD